MMDPVPDHMVKYKDDNIVKLISGKEFLKMTKEEDFLGICLNRKVKGWGQD